MNKKIISIILTVCMLLTSTLPVFATEYSEGRQNIFIKYDHRFPNSYDKGWRDSGYSFETHGRIVPFRPEHDYVSEQNPPDFMWPLNANADSYDLVVAKDPELKEIAFEKTGIDRNFYNFEHTFETGVYYYWAVRFNIGGKLSGWSDARRFRIQPDAHEFTTPDLETLLARIPKDHPRVYTTKANLEAYRAIGDGATPSSQSIKRSYISLAETRLKSNIEELVPEDFPMPTEEEKKSVRWGQNLRSKVATGYSGLINLGYAYLLSGDERYAKRCVQEMLRISKWDPTGATSYKTQDQIHREIMLNLAMALDWCWDVATEAERKIVIEHILRRMDDMEYLLDTIPKNPYDSHGWTAYGFIGIAGIALYGETPRAEKWLRAIIPTYAAFLPPWGNQDGGWSQGTGYWQYSSQTNRDLMDVLLDAGVVDLYGKAWQQNEYLWMMYATPHGSFGSFGDETNINQTFGSYVPELAGGIAYRSKDEHVAKVSRWLANQYGPLTTPQGYLINTSREDGEIAPYDYPLAHEFNDIGWVVMTDDLISSDRIQMTFKASHWGSFNHSQADQNSFTIQAYGKKLASRGGYYDAYHTAHDSGITRKTAAHNSVTLATNRGQQDDNINAKGELTAYLNHMDFDLVTGDATPAYVSNKIDYFERHMIYIRPDIFVVIDDLDGNNKKEEKFEWWLNTDTDIEVYDGGVNGCRTQNGNAVLDTQVHYPQNVKTYYNNIHALSDMIEIPAAAPYDKANVQRRVWFETEKVESTKMIVSMDVHKADVGARAIDTEYGENYVKMTYENGTVVIVNINKNETTEITVGNISFTGAAVVYNDESIMLVSGTSLKEGGLELIKSEKLCSVVMGKNEISLSTYEDNKISLHNNNDYVNGIAEVKNENDNLMGPEWGLTITEGAKIVLTDAPAEEKKEEAKKETKKTTSKAKEPAKEEAPEVVSTSTLEENADYTTFDCFADNYTLVTNGKSIKSDTNVSATVKVYIDGMEVGVYEISGYTKRDGTANYMGEVVIPSAKYEFEKATSGISFGGHTLGSSAIMGTVAVATPNKENEVYLKTVPSRIVPLKETNGDQDSDTLKSKLTIFKEAEDAVKLAPSSKTYDTRTWLSGGIGVQLHNQVGESATYSIKVEEAGYYDIGVKYVAWDFDNTSRAFAINGVSYVIPLPRTDDYGTIPDSWKYAVGDCNIYLEPGEYMLSIEAMEGSWNYDYFGFIKRP